MRKQIISTVLYLCSVIDHTWRQNVVRPSVTHSTIALFATFFSTQGTWILFTSEWMSSCGIYLLNILHYKPVLYLGLGPQLASGFSWYLRSFFCLEAGFAPDLASKDTWITGSLLRIAEPGELTFFLLTGWSFSQHLMISHTTREWIQTNKLLRNTGSL